AEKALFRALKTRTNTPKHGLLFHSAFIGKASIKNKGRISRFLANKCTIASRIDCFSDIPVPTFGEFLKQQVEDRLTYFETGQVPKKNLEVMRDATSEAEPVIAKVIKKRKKAAKRARKAAEEETNGHANGGQTEIEEVMEVDEDEPKPKKKKKAKKQVEVEA
ncbi:UNVERIFIED_CONTAM: Nucleolar protein 56, partial [Eudyptes robustus]